ncbi:MAG: TonB family protein, partial [Myxococcota bacterium]
MRWITALGILAIAFGVPLSGVAQEDGEGEEEGPVLVPPELRDFVQAAYPAAAEAEGIEATVVLELTISAEGTVTEARVVTAVGNGFDEAAVAAAERFIFVPATRDGEPVPARIRYRYVFELVDEPPVEPDPTEPEVPPPGRLMGRILEAGDEDPLPRAEVIATSEDGAISRRAVTAEDGAFRFDDLPPGSYRVAVYADDYDEFGAVEEVASNEITEVVYRVTFIEEADSEGFSATAVIDAPPREVIRRTITREELTRVPGTRGDALRTVELLPGVGRPPFGAGQLIVRGSAPNDSQVFLDGVSVPLLYHFGGLTSFFNSRMLERIDFFPGNFSARFGRKIGGVLDVETREPAMDRFRGVADINVIDASLLLEAPLGETASIAAAGRRSYIDFFFENIVPDDAFDVVAAPVYYDYQLIASWRPTDQDRFKAVIYGSSDRFSIILSDPSDDDPEVRGNLDLTTQFHRLFVSWRRQFSEDIDATLQVSAGPTLLDFSLGEAISFDATFWQVEVRNEWRFRLSNRLQLIAGVDVNLTPFELEYMGPPPDQSE